MVWFEKMKIELKQDGKIGTGQIEKELENKREKKDDSNWKERRIEKRSRFEKMARNRIEEKMKNECRIEKKENLRVEEEQTCLCDVLKNEKIAVQKYFC